MYGYLERGIQTTWEREFNDGARLVRLIITMIKRIRTSRLSIKNSLSLDCSRRRSSEGPCALRCVMQKGKLTAINFGADARQVDIRLPGKGNSNSRGARPVC